MPKSSESIVSEGRWLKSATGLVFSPCGGTLKVMEALGEGVPGGLTINNLTRPENRREQSFGAGDLVIFGFPVYAGRVPQGVTETIFERLTGHDTPAVLVAVYGNREFEGALLDLEKLAVSRGFRPVAAAAAVAEHSIVTEVATGRPDGQDRELLATFGREIYERLARESGLAAYIAARGGNFRAPGQYPEPKPTGSPRLSCVADPDICLNCGLCEEVCPTLAIPEGEGATTRAELCLACMACQHVCPVGARSLNHPNPEQLAGWLKSVAGTRKEALFFY